MDRQEEDYCELMNEVEECYQNNGRGLYSIIIPMPDRISHNNPLLVDPYFH